MNTALMGGAGRTAGHQRPQQEEGAEGHQFAGDQRSGYTTTTTSSTTSDKVGTTSNPGGTTQTSSSSSAETNLTFPHFKDTCQGQPSRSVGEVGVSGATPGGSSCSGGALDLVFSQSLPGLTGGSLTSTGGVLQQPFDPALPDLEPSVPADLQVVCSTTTTTMTVGRYDDAASLRHHPGCHDNVTGAMTTYYGGNHGNLPVVMVDGGQVLPNNQYALQQHHNNQQHQHQWPHQHVEGQHHQMALPSQDLYTDYEGFDPQLHHPGYTGCLQEEAVFRANHGAFPHPVDLQQQHMLPSFVDQDDSTLFFRNVGCYNFTGVGANGVAGSKPKRRRVPTLAQRRAANIRERRRMYNLNEAFDSLRTKVPTFAYEKRLSRIETLRLAMTYISFMADIVNGRGDGPLGGQRQDKEGKRDGEKRQEGSRRKAAGEDDEGEDKENQVTETLTDSDPDVDREDDGDGASEENIEL